MRRLLSDRRGSALVASLVLVALALLVTSMVTIRATIDAQRVVAAERQAIALNAAEAGIAEAIQRLRWDPWMGDAHGEIGRAKWTIEMHHEVVGVTNHFVTLDVEATAIDQSRRIRLRVDVQPSLALDQPASITLVDWVLLP